MEPIIELTPSEIKAAFAIWIKDVEQNPSEYEDKPPPDVDHAKVLTEQFFKCLGICHVTGKKASSHA